MTSAVSVTKGNATRKKNIVRQKLANMCVCVGGGIMMRTLLFSSVLYEMNPVMLCVSKTNIRLGGPD